MVLRKAVVTSTTSPFLRAEITGEACDGGIQTAESAYGDELPAVLLLRPIVIDLPSGPLLLRGTQGLLGPVQKFISR